MAPVVLWSAPLLRDVLPLMAGFMKMEHPHFKPYGGLSLATKAVKPRG